MARKKSLRNVGKFILRQDRMSNPRNEYPLYIQYTLEGKVAKESSGWSSIKMMVSAAASVLGTGMLSSSVPSSFKCLAKRDRMN